MPQSVWWRLYSSGISTSINLCRTFVRPQLTRCWSWAWSLWTCECMTIYQRPLLTLVCTFYTPHLPSAECKYSWLYWFLLHILLLAVRPEFLSAQQRQFNIFEVLSEKINVMVVEITEHRVGYPNNHFSHFCLKFSWLCNKINAANLLTKFCLDISTRSEQ